MTTPDIRIEIQNDRTGQVWTQVPRIRIDSDFLVPTDGCTFSLLAPNPKELRGLVGEPISIKVNDKLQFIGRVERRRVGHNGAENVFMCRDHMSGLCEGRLRDINVVKNEAIYDLIKRVGAPYGITTVYSDSDIDMREVRSGRSTISGKIPTTFVNKKHEDFAAQFNQGAMQYLMEVVARHGATLQPGPDRNSVVVSCPHYDQEPSYGAYRTIGYDQGYKQGVSSGPRAVDGGLWDPGLPQVSNILHGERNDQWDKVPTFLEAKGLFGLPQEKRTPMDFSYNYLAELIGLVAPELLDKITDTFVTEAVKNGTYVDPIKIYRPYYFEDNESRNADQLRHAALRLISETLKDTLVYTATMNGLTHEETGRVWTVNTILQVYDEVADVNENLWILNRALDVNAGGDPGAVCEITAIRPGTIQL